MIRMLFLGYYFHGPINYSRGTGLGISRHWDWPVQDSFLYPGADIAFMDVDALAKHCPQAVLGDADMINEPGERREYRFDLTATYRCASDAGLFDVPMPEHEPVDLVGAHWGVESTLGNHQIWASVENMRILPGKNHWYGRLTGSSHSPKNVVRQLGLNNIPATATQCESVGCPVVIDTVEGIHIALGASRDSLGDHGMVPARAKAAKKLHREDKPMLLREMPWGQRNVSE